MFQEGESFHILEQTVKLSLGEEGERMLLLQSGAVG